jgi:hypothetical protein
MEVFPHRLGQEIDVVRLHQVVDAFAYFFHWVFPENRQRYAFTASQYVIVFKELMRSYRTAAALMSTILPTFNMPAEKLIAPDRTCQQALLWPSLSQLHKPRCMATIYNNY